MTEGWDAETYLDEIRVEIPWYEELQEVVVDATRGPGVRRILELGVGTGETTRRLLAAHAAATVVGIDGSESMLAAARAELPADRVELRRSRFEEPLPEERFDLVVSVLAVHHLPPEAKADLFARIAMALDPGGRFVFGDVVVPERPEDVTIELEEGFDLPDRVDDQVSWLAAAGLEPQVVWRRQDFAVLRGDAHASG